MNLSLFDQFASPQLIGIPLIIIAISLPAALILSTNKQLANNRPTTLQSWLKIMFTKQLLLPLSSKGRKWAAILTSLMMFLTTANLLGLLPYTFTPTTQLSLNMSLAAPMWLATVLTGLKNQPTLTLGHLLPEGTPTPLIPALILIETISLFIRPLALGVRLTANLVAGHLLIQLISMATITIMSTLPTVATLTFLILLLLSLLELAVALIQAFVFTLLLSLYLQENT
uniref:ATP synthase subunit a n=1 Tax=Varanus salvator TaxID=62051 RepID=B3GT34_VARSL|nr:ATP synthase F0 subunit 6 [Varanus salvator]ACD81914.1 ATP synthase F0 subunit 6 [Varanus salvator]BAU25929.1 ATP synthase F0 subunit 6 [Varanus salvator]